MSAPQVALQAEAEYLGAFTAIMNRIEGSIEKRPEPVVLYIGGGAALHLYTGARVSNDIDAAVLSRFLPPANLNAAYRGADGHARLLYFDTRFNGDFPLLHPDAYRDSKPVTLPGLDARKLEVRLLAPIDLAVSKLSRFDEGDQAGILALAQARLIEPGPLQQRVDEALGIYRGDVSQVREALEAALRLVKPPSLH